MHKSIGKVLEERRLRAAKASVRGSESIEQEVREHARQVKSLLSGKLEPQQDALWYVLKNAYYDLLREYKGDWRRYIAPAPTKTSMVFWNRVAAAQAASRCTPADFITAQFDWFDKNFGRAPELCQLTTEAAIDRALNYSGNVRRVISNAKKADVSLADTFRQCENQVRDICRAQKLSREEFYTSFVLTNIVVLPKEFLNADPVYAKVLNEQP